MRKEEKTLIINGLVEQLKASAHFYIADTSGLNAESTSKLRRKCFEQQVKLMVVKNTLLQKALEQIDFPEPALYDVLKGSSSVMFSETANAPAKLIKEFRKEFDKEKPAFKGAYVQESLYIGEDQLESLVNIKSRDELIAEVIGLLQSPAKAVISALQSGGQTLSGIVKTLSDKPE